jgi:DNA-binding CsgD family transcriptional regulator
MHSVLLVPLEGEALLGRSTGCDLVLDHPSVSRRHAFLAAEGPGLRVTDLASKNGTFLDDVRVAGEAAAAAGSRIRFGSLEFLIAGHEGAAEVPSSSLETGTDGPSPSGQPPAGQTDGGRLSVAQSRVFQLLLAGTSEKRIASRLGLSPHTVHNHVTAIYRTFRVHSRGELLALALAGRAVT